MFRRGWGKVFISISVFVFTLSASNIVLAGCPDGESERPILLPNGIETTLCVPDMRVNGFETVSDQSEDSIVSGTCPSLNDEDITYYMGKGTPSGCWYDTHRLLCCS